VSKKISIALATFNAKKYIVKQLESVVYQTRRPDEIVIADDASTDGTCDLIALFSESHKDISFKIICNSTRVGPTFNFERAMLVCTGDIVFLCDQDDVWDEQKIEIMEHSFDCDSIDLVFCDAYIWQGDAKIAGPTLWQTVGFSPDRYDPCENLLRKTIAFGLTMAYRNTEKLRNVLFPYPKLWGHDGWLALICTAIGDVGFVNRPLLYYRQHPLQVSGAYGIKSATSKSLIPDSDAFFYFVKRVETVSQRGKNYGKVVDFVARKSQHLRKRERVTSYNALLRPLAALRLLTKGEYHKYSNGLRSFLKDILMLDRV